MQKFHCEVEGCLYGIGSERHFKSKKLLKQHLVKVHSEKKHICTKCGKGFGSEQLQKLHENTCGMMWECFTCKKSYTCRETLLTHERRTQHAITAPLQSPLRKRKAKPVEPVGAPVIIIFNGFSDQYNAPKCRQILPKTGRQTHENLSSSAIAALALSELAQQSKVSTVTGKKSVAIQTVPVTVVATAAVCSSDGDSKLPSAHAETTNGCLKRQNAFAYEVGTAMEEWMMPQSNILMQAMEMASIPVKTKSHSVQCSPLFRTAPTMTAQSKKQKRKESIHTQTSESTLVALKGARRSSNKAGPRFASSTDNLHKTSSYTDVPRDIEDCMKGVLSRVNCFMFDGNGESSEDLRQIDDLITHCSSSTQTSSYLRCLKGLCNMQTDATDFQSSPTTGHSMNYEQTSIGPSCRAEAAYLTAFSRSEPLTLDGECGSSVHAAVNTTMQECLNTQTQTDISEVNLLTANMEQSIQTELDTLRLFSTIETQTVSEEDFDYPAHVLTHMETQTTEDFFNSLELADIETQTVWEDISDLVSSAVPSDEACCVRKMCSSPVKQDSADLMDMETQTPFEFCGPELIDSYAQTLDLEFNPALFNS